MHLKYLRIQNFRAIEDITIKFDGVVNVIVGPNAIGKTTILEAIRFAKALLAPRTATETNQALIGLGAVSPHMPQLMSFAAIARDVTKSVEIRCRYELSGSQINHVRQSIPQIAANLVQAQLGQQFGNPAAVIQFLSTPEGQSALANATAQLSKNAERFDTDRSCVLELIIGSQGIARGTDQFAQLIAGHLDRELAPAETIFTYFPADRALPSGEVAVQLGAADASQQIESHNSQPALKYGRLKNTIFSTIVRDAAGREDLEKEFGDIFSTVLKGRRLDFIGVNDRGLLSIRVADTGSNRVFDIDSMSSGEKGLILSFLLISRSLAQGGLLLLDEPELHLNPAVCKDVLSFLVERYILPKNAQAIICTHSPEILASALDRDDCRLFHLRSESEITMVRPHDEDEVVTSLQILGSSQSESLLYRGTIFVEGSSDVDLIETGFEEAIRRFKVRDLGGRGNVENEVRRLQRAEKNGADVPLTIFLFDLDRQVSMLASSKKVRVVQWQRRNIENYLLDLDILTDLLTSDEFVAKPLKNMGEVSKLIQKITESQLLDVAVSEVYNARNYDSVGLRRAEVEGKSLVESADILIRRIEAVRESLSPIIADVWRRDFTMEVEEKISELKTGWEIRWQELCDGKRVFAEIQAELSPRMSLARFKRHVMLQLRLKRRESWVIVNELLSTAVQ